MFSSVWTTQLFSLYISYHVENSPLPGWWLPPLTAASPPCERCVVYVYSCILSPPCRWISNKNIEIWLCNVCVECGQQRGHRRQDSPPGSGRGRGSAMAAVAYIIHSTSSDAVERVPVTDCRVLCRSVGHFLCWTFSPDISSLLYSLIDIFPSSTLPSSDIFPSQRFPLKHFLFLNGLNLYLIPIYLSPLFKLITPN